MKPFIELQKIGLDFGKQTIFEDLNLQVEANEFISIIGKSGTGKTTLIRMIAGLLAPTSGRVLINGEAITEPHKEITYVFQKPVLLEWRNLLENVLLPIELERKVTTKDIDKAKEVLKLVHLEEDQAKYPHECSGGMVSRVSLARALITNPKILLMDEPFAALDSITKEQLQLELTQIISTYHSTVIFITHDIQEAVFLSDRVVLINENSNKVNEFIVPFPRPRHKDLKFEPEFQQLIKQIYESLEMIEG
ncbi:ABC transporter ATP-binding protein [Aquibacillus koreensis]|uniref:ABC transporter ATP-binding protein n=1 Tax=Aquibacillus koreensis TaxID=279446 RepID=A0A9X4AIZ6_9BACI|nr:ABC transporter ATP-binding protein [Aquibacillus koreensis]MCT2536748.1 ABC transporter ATP-binding protein [Aquibacillus koreensis]MDC3421496.1 ABC transporter ATP-binding protein [Aquibacillus koreensis]